MAPRGESPEARGYRRTAVANQIKPRYPELLQRSIVPFDPGLVPAAFPSKQNVLPELRLASNNEATIPSDTDQEMVTVDLEAQHGQKRKRNNEDAQSMPEFEEVEEEGFSVFIDWTTSNALQNPIWRNNLPKALTENESKQSGEISKEDYGDVLTRNQREIEAAILTPRNGGDADTRSGENTAIEAGGEGVTVKVLILPR